MKKRGLAIFTCRFFTIISLTTIILATGVSGPAMAQQSYEISISTLPAGFSSYIMGVALAELINKNSKWLKATAMEGRGPAEHMKLLVKKPDKRKNYLFFNTTWDIWEAKKEIGPYKGFPFDYDEFRFVFMKGIAGNGLSTLDPNIKGVKDLVGKKAIFDSSRGKGRQITYHGVLKEAGVPVEKIKHQYASGKAAADTLRDGLVDVIYTGHVLKKLPYSFANSPFFAELVATKKVYFVSFDEKPVMAYKANSGHPLSMVKVPPKTLGPLQTEPCGILLKPLGFCAHISMPDRVVTEVVRIAYENAHKFKEYTPMGAIITKETLASLGIPEKAYHPAAVKFFKEKGIKITGLK